MNSPIRTKQYAGRCARCGADVPAKAGVLLRTVWGSWVTYHPVHAPTPDPDGTTSDTSAIRPIRETGSGRPAAQSFRQGWGCP